MKALKQLLRQPMKSLFGVALITTAVAVLCVCLGQSFAAKETEERLNETYMTAAFVESGKSADWLNAYAEEHPEVVQSLSYAGLASAYISELTLDNWTQHWHKPLMLTPNTFAPYDTAILEIILTEISLVPHVKHLVDTLGYCPILGTSQYKKVPFGYEIITDGPEDGADPSDEPSGEDGLTVYLTGTVRRAVCLQEGYADPTGFTARITLHLPDQSGLDALNLAVGERYLVSGTNYRDEDWMLRHESAAQMSWNKEKELPQWELDTFEWRRDTSVTQVNEETGEVEYEVRVFGPGSEGTIYFTKNIEDLPLLGFICKIGDLYHGMDLEEYAKFQSVSLTIDKMQHTDAYQQPAIARLEARLEEFLASEEGALWAEALHNAQVNNHAFAVIGVDKLRYMENFNSGEAEIVHGRDFTKEELETGARICVISKQLAEANGLTLGDTINPQFYDPDPSLAYQLPMSLNTFTPKPLYYFCNTTQLTEAQNYTIVGIYEQNNPTPSLVDTSGNTVNAYGFTSNTIFVPKASVSAAMQYSESWLFKTVVIHNGALEAFQLAAIEAGLGEDFRYTDNGYAAVEESLVTYRENANRALWIGITVYTIVMALYLLLFLIQQKSVLITMETLGADRGKRICHVLSGSLWLLVPGSLLGTGIGMRLWEKVVDMLTEGSPEVLGIQLRVSSLAGIGGMQLLLAMGVVALLAVPITRGLSLMKRK